MLGRTHLGGDYNVASVPAKMLDSSAHYFLGFTPCVPFCAVEEIDPGIVSCFETGECVVVANVATICEPATQRNSRDLKTCLAYEAILHLRDIFRDFRLRHGV